MTKTTKRIILLVTISFFLVGRIAVPLPVLAADKISKSAPQFSSTPLEDVAKLEQQEENQIGAGTWILALLGVAVLAALGGGGGGGGGGGTGTPATTGDVTVGW